MKLILTDLKMRIEPTNACNDDINIFACIKGSGDEIDYRHLAELENSKEGIMICSLLKYNELLRINSSLRSQLDIIKYCTNDVISTYNIARPYIYPEPTKVIFNGPATIVFWNDGSKTVVKCQNKDKFDMEKGFAMACTKKLFGNEGNYYNRFREVPMSIGSDLYIPKETENGQT